ncbi:MAG: hypothetical protein FWG73_09660 [Planctomycetaceae bacterium]|nr:hypothetical protein [Planctomycetaceae bacterium]
MNKNISCAIIALLAFSLVAVLMVSIAATGFCFYRYSTIARSNHEAIFLLEESAETSEALTSFFRMQENFYRTLLDPRDEIARREFEEAYKETIEVLKYIASTTSVVPNRMEADELLVILQRIDVKNRELVRQGNTREELRLTCNGISAVMREKLEVVGHALELHIRNSNEGNAIDLMELNLRIYEAQGLFYPVLQSQDGFAFSSDRDIQVQLKALLHGKMAELQTALERIRNHPHLPSEFTGSIDGIIADCARWETALATYIEAVDQQRAMQEEILAHLRHVLSGILSLENRNKLAVFARIEKS